MAIPTRRRGNGRRFRACSQRGRNAAFTGPARAGGAENSRKRLCVTQNRTAAEQTARGGHRRGEKTRSASRQRLRGVLERIGSCKQLHRPAARAERADGECPSPSRLCSQPCARLRALCRLACYLIDGGGLQALQSCPAMSPVGSRELSPSTPCAQELPPACQSHVRSHPGQLPRAQAPRPAHPPLSHTKMPGPLCPLWCLQPPWRHPPPNRL